MSQDISVVRYEELPQKDGFRQQRVSFTFGKRSRTVTGILKLVQMVMKMLLTTPGTDKFAPDIGTNIPALTRRGVSQGSSDAIKMEITIAIQDLERRIQDIQAAQAIPDNERLRSLLIRRVEYLPASAEWMIDLSVLSEAGEGVAFDVSQYLKGK